MRSKKWYFLPLGWHNCDQCLGALPASVGQDRSKCNESAGSQNLFCQSLSQLVLQSAHRQTMVFWHNWRSNKDISHRWSSGLYGMKRGKHANSQITIWSTHIIPCEKCKLNPCLKTIFFFHWCYSPLWAVAHRTMPLNFSLSITNSLHLLTPVTWTSLSTSSLHLSWVKQTILFPKIIHFN
jgi:hypothetical protein